MVTLVWTLSIISNAQSINLTNRPFWDGEPFLEISPNDPNKLIIAYMSYTQFSAMSINILTSEDGGISWNGPFKIPHAVTGYSSADPVLHYDNNGILYLVYVDYLLNHSDGAIYLRKSYDDGLTWTDPIKVISVNDDSTEKPIDRPWMATTDGKTIYVTSIPPVKSSTLPNRPYLSVSYDSGYTWNWTYLDSGNYSVGNTIKAPMPSPVAKADTLFAVYPAYMPSQSLYPRYVMAKFYNNTRVYKDILTIVPSPGNDSLKRSHLLLKNPANEDHLVFLYPSTQYGDPDILMIESFNSGISWTSPLRLNDDQIGNNMYQDMLWGAFSQDGSLAVCWRDRRNGGTFANAGYDFYCTVRKANSQDFSPNIRISHQTYQFDTLLLLSGNDFMSCGLTDSFLYVVWGAYDYSGMNIWFARVNLHTDTVQSFPVVWSQNSIDIIRSGHNTLIIKSQCIIKEIKIFDLQGKILYVRKPDNTIANVNFNNLTNNTIIQIHSSCGNIFLHWTF